jgi:predicted TIM-barrel fold metal-dependent hydrolase
MGFIDADAHVDETRETFEYMHPADSLYKPILLDAPGWDYLGPDIPPHPLWVIGGNVRLKRYRDDELTGTTQAARELLDINTRLRHMDELGFDVQVIYPTLFLHAVTAQPEVEAAIHGAYNRWLASKTAESNGRLRWAYIPSTLSIEKSVAELEWAKEHGACAIFKKGVEYHRRASDPYYFPLYAEAERLNMPICFHQGEGSLASNVGQTNGGPFASMAVYNVLAAFNMLAAAGVPDRFPQLRFGFIEAGASWIPYEIKVAGMRGASEKYAYEFKTGFLKHHNFFVTCDTDDDIPMLVEEFGAEDNLIIGTDYGHRDPSHELAAHQVVTNMARRGEITEDVARKITSDNGRRLYGL